VDCQNVKKKITQMSVNTHVILKLPFHKLEFKALQRTSISVGFILGYSTYKYAQTEKTVTRVHTD